MMRDRVRTIAGRIAPAWTGALALLALASPAAGQPAETSKVSAKDITRPTGRTRLIDFTVDEGTAMNLSVTPDSRWIVFDLLAHVYRLPMNGGEAECLTGNSGVALNVQPRVSPDGKWIAFVSDRSGQNNLWVMGIDGSNPRPLYQSLTVQAVEPMWTFDSQAVMIRHGDTVMKYPLDGGPPSEVGKHLWSISSPSDGRYLYYATTVRAFYGWSGLGARDPMSGTSEVRRRALADNSVSQIIAGGNSQNNARFASGGGVAPQVSPDGRWLAFARRLPEATVSYKGHAYGPRNALWIRDLETGEEHVVADPIEQDLPERMASPALPGYGWTSDSRFILISGGGHILKVDVAARKSAIVPFTARVKRVISEQAQGVVPIDDSSPFESRFTLWHSASPDDRRLAFQAVGRIWVQDLPSGKPRRLTPDSFAPIEYGPAWSPDGRWIAFATVDAQARGALWKVSVAGGPPIRLTAQPGEYANPAWRPDGAEIIASLGAGASLRGRPSSHDAYSDIIRIPASGGTVTRIARVNLTVGESWALPPRPTYADGRIFYRDRVSLDPVNDPIPLNSGAEAPNDRVRITLVSILPDGSDRREHAIIPEARDMAVSPDARQVAFADFNHVYVAALPARRGDAAPVIDRLQPDSGAKRVSDHSAFLPHWRSKDILEFGTANIYSRFDLRSGRRKDVALHLLVRPQVPQGRIALTNGRILTMKGREIIERGSLIVEGGRLACVGTCATAGADRVIDLQGRTVLPGFVDMHGHRLLTAPLQLPSRDYLTAASLAFGVTTDLDPDAWSMVHFPAAEMTRAGMMIGPRAYSTAEPIGTTEREPIENAEQADEAVGRRQQWGATTVKQYGLTRRDARQWLVEAGRRHHMTVTGEGGDLNYVLGVVMDGQAGSEHLIPNYPLYADVVRFLGMASFTYSATPVGIGGDLWNEDFFFQETDVWKDPKTRLWNPDSELYPHARRRGLRPLTDYVFPVQAQSVADIVLAGGYGAMGTHTRLYGLAAVWDLRLNASGMDNFAALDIATRQGAHFLGASRDIGTLEPGKIADLIVVDSDPLVDMRNIEALRYVMKGGILYDAATLDEIWPAPRPFGERYWLNPDEKLGDIAVRP